MSFPYVSWMRWCGFARHFQQISLTSCSLCSVLVWPAVALNAQDDWVQTGHVVHALDESATIECSPEMLRLLEQRVADDPEDAGAWRLLGRARFMRNDLEGAREALERSLSLDPYQAAAFFDLGQLACKLDQLEAALTAFQQVLVLAPESDYATEARDRIVELELQRGVMLASYDIRTFDASNLDGYAQDRLLGVFPNRVDGMQLQLELASQYNSNVTLAPSSRELAGGNRAGAQAVASLSTRWLYPAGQYRIGPTFELDYTLNEGNLEHFNLQSYRPGLMADTKYDFRGYKLRPRVAYLFTHDEFDGSTFGNRHTFVTSLATSWSRCQTSTVLWSIDVNDLVNDGPVPDVSSQDGLSNTVGLIHDWTRPQSCLRSVRAGMDVQHVDAQGSTYRFLGGSVYSQVVFVPVARTEWSVKGGWVYRDYYDFSLTPSRDTHILRASTELRRYFDAGFSASIFARYDDFVSQNDNFDPTRFLSGGAVTWEY